VLRAGNTNEPGLVLGDPLSAQTRSYEDDWVQAGQTYWYQFVAIDAAGNRSQPGEAVQVYAANLDIPTAGKPSASYTVSPMRQVRLNFNSPPEGLNAIVQASMDSVHWRNVYGPARGDTATDLNLPKQGRVHYRVIYQAANGTSGGASDEAMIELP